MGEKEPTPQDFNWEEEWRKERIELLRRMLKRYPGVSEEVRGLWRKEIVDQGGELEEEQK
ncbi:MAG: hypothetical protein AAB884_00695 [Patescibacteria group bacterium]